MRSKRFASVSIARGIAIVAMIETHVHWIIGGTAFGMGPFAAPFFLMVSGVSFELFLSSRRNGGASKRDLFFESLRRALALYFITLLIGFAGKAILVKVYGNASLSSLGFSFGFLSWTIFQVMAAGYILGFVLRSLFSRVLTVIVIFAVTLLLNRYNVPFISFLSVGAFPLLPWLSYFIAGQILSSLYFKRAILKSKAIYTILGLSLITVVAGYICNYRILTISRNIIPVFLMLCSVQFIILWLLNLIVDHKGSKLLTPVESIGNIAFSSFYIHFAAIFAIKMLPGYKVIPYVDLIIILVLISGLWCLERYWRKYNYFLGAGWCLRKCASMILNVTKKLLVKKAVPCVTGKADAP